MQMRELIVKLMGEVPRDRQRTAGPVSDEMSPFFWRHRLG